MRCGDAPSFALKPWLAVANSDLIVIGGGVIGLSIAWEAQRRGRHVVIMDQQSIGRGTSWTAAGILPPAVESQATDPIDRLRGWSHRLHPQWAAELKEITGIDNGLRRSGGLYLATTPGEAAALLGLEDYWQSQGIATERIDAAALADLEPRLGPFAQSGRLRLALRLEDEYQIRSPDHLRALRSACDAGGVQLREATAVNAIEPHPDHVIVVAGNDRYRCSQAVLAGGSWSGRLGHTLGLELQVVPVRGQILMYQLRSPPLRHVVNEGNRYFVAREDGHLLIGSSEEEVGFDDSTTDAALELFRSWATNYLPELKNVDPVRAWAGLRPSTIDGFPYIGRVPGQPALFVASGHYRSGIHLSCATAVALLDVMEGLPPPALLDAFRVGRGLPSR